jgi:O-phospho-L-seryl-tRNASec:L-selenocysteinyl-tRNA synthase
MVKELLTQRQLPSQGFDELTLNYLMDELALMDSNNFHEKIGVGERESRIFCPLVQRRNFYMGHGIGRSGDIMANQPKAAGSSLLLQLTKYLTVSALK